MEASVKYSPPKEGDSDLPKPPNTLWAFPDFRSSILSDMFMLFLTNLTAFLAKPSIPPIEAILKTCSSK